MKYLILFFILFQNNILFSQHPDAKRDYVWRTGYNTWNAYRFNTALDFSLFPTKVDSILKKNPNDGQVGMICNTGGDFLLFSNGCQISDKYDNLIQGTEKLNEGNAHNRFCPPMDIGFYHPQSMVVLAQPNDTNTFCFFHTNLSLRTSGYYDADKWLFTKVVKDRNNRFSLVYRDSLIVQDSLENSHMTACRHANGRDWWIVQPRAISNKYYKILWTPRSMNLSSQSIGVASTDFESTGGQAVFSPDGTKYVRYNIQSDIRIFDFNRCSGQLSNPLHIPIQDAADTIGFAGCAISANSQFLYVISTDKIYQYDLKAPNIQASKIVVLNYDGGMNPIGLRYTFAQGQLGPDGKIYVSNTGGRDALHLIEAPDSAGLACRAVQRRFRLSNGISYALPYFPNFRLGALRGSPCDTLTANQERSSRSGYEMKLYPNPAIEMLSIDVTMPDFDQANATIEIHDVLGNQVYQAPLPPFASIHNVNVSFFVNGLYIISLKINGKTKSVQKETILH